MISDQRFILHYGDMTDATNLFAWSKRRSQTRSTISRPKAMCRSPSRRRVHSQRRRDRARCDCSRPSYPGPERKTAFLPGLDVGTVRPRLQPLQSSDAFLSAQPLRRRQALRLLDDVNYRETFGLHASCGILFNHESPLRGIEYSSPARSSGRSCCSICHMPRRIPAHGPSRGSRRGYPDRVCAAVPDEWPRRPV